LPDEAAIDLHSHIKNQMDQNNPINILQYIQRVSKYEQGNSIILTHELKFDRKLNDKVISFMNIQPKWEDDNHKRRLIALGLYDDSVGIAERNQKFQNIIPAPKPPPNPFDNASRETTPQNFDVAPPREVIFVPNKNGVYNIQFPYKSKYYTCPIENVIDPLIVPLMMNERTELHPTLMHNTKMIKDQAVSKQIQRETYLLNKANPENVLPAEMKSVAAEIFSTLEQSGAVTRRSGIPVPVDGQNSAGAAPAQINAASAQLNSIKTQYPSGENMRSAPEQNKTYV